MTYYQFDRKIPFINLIFRLIAGEDVLDKAIDILEKAEMKHHLQIWYHPENVLDGDRYIPKNRKPVIISTLNAQLVDSRIFYKNYDRLDMQHSLVRQALQNLHGFLSETSCVIQGADFTNEHYILFADSLIFTASQRFWGDTLAEWANTINWQGQSEWTYVDFYVDFPYIFPEYQEWVKVVLYVIHTKCKRALQRLAANDSLGSE